MRTLIGLFQDSSEARETISDLQKLGAKAKDISVVAPVGSPQLGTGLQMSPVDVPGLGRVAACGPMTNYLSQATARQAPDAIISALVQMGMPDVEARRYVDGVREGYTLETVVVEDDKADEALEIMRVHSIGGGGGGTGLGTDSERGIADSSGDAVLPVIVEELEVATSEEPFITKRARVIEEIVIRKNVGSKTETVHGTVRRTDVDVQPFNASDFRPHYDQTYGKTDTTGTESSDYDFSSYQPAYKFGGDMRMDETYSADDWSGVEPNARKTWEEKNPGTWGRFRDAIKHAWERAKGT